jgi:hypothetical protein
MNNNHDNTPDRQAPRAKGEVLEACLVPLEPSLDSFHGVLVELYDLGERRSRRSGKPRYRVIQSAAGSGRVITNFVCDDEAEAYDSYHELRRYGVFGAEVSYRQVHR